MYRYYVGVSRFSSGRNREIFRSGAEPTPDTHGDRYTLAIGPFRTKLAAEIMAIHGDRNPHLQHVRDAERLAREGRVRLRKKGFLV